MGYVLHKMSEKAWKMFVPHVPKKRPELPTPKRKTFPFARMKIGDAFYLRDHETTPPMYVNCRDYINRYNRTYACHFVMIRHKDYYEIARIV